MEMLALVKNITELTDVFALMGIQAKPAGTVKRATLLSNARTFSESYLGKFDVVG